MGETNPSPLLPVFQMPFYVLVTANLVVYTTEPGHVGVDKLATGLSGYLMLGFTWSSVYLLTERLVPGSFVSANGGTVDQFDLLYFSFVTLTTLGYGDILPATDHARSFAILEAVVGSFYMVVLIARLVGTFGGQSGVAPQRQKPAAAAEETSPASGA